MKNISIVFLLLFLLSCDNETVILRNDNGGKEQKINGNVCAVTENTSYEVSSNPINDENYSDFTLSPNGLLYKFHRINSGSTLTPNDVAEIEMNYFLNDSLLFTSHDYAQKFNMPIEHSVFKGDLYEGLSMMHVGDSASFVTKADSTYIKLWKRPSKGIKDTDVIRFDISVLSKEDRNVFSQRIYAKKRAQAEQSRNDLQVYLHDNNVVERPRPSGLIIQTIIKGYGEKATSGDKVKVHYTAELINGEVYKSTRYNNIPEILTLSNLPKVHPRGLDEALHQMREGEIAKVIIPSHLAFGQQEIYNLPPFANFVYEIEVLEVIK